MKDSDQYYAILRERADILHQRIDHALSALMDVDYAVKAVARADLDVGGEPGRVEHDDLIRCVETAAFSMRTAERIAREHLDDVRRAAAGEITRA